MYSKKAKSGIGIVLALLVFVAVLVVLVVGMSGFSGKTAEEETNVVRDAIQRASILCYASEGFYPPSLKYIEENYGVQINKEKFSVRYEVFATNVMPVIKVVRR